MAAKGKIKKPNAVSGNHIKPPEEAVNYEMSRPVFSLERLQDGDYCFSKLQKDDRALFADAIFRRRTSTWQDIRNMDRHGLGCEKISKSSIKTAIPAFIKDDVTHFLAFRFSGKKPMVGYKIKDIFYVLWFDHNFTVYPHG